jgi:hypothetical protein
MENNETAHGLCLKKSGSPLIPIGRLSATTYRLSLPWVASLLWIWISPMRVYLAIVVEMMVYQGLQWKPLLESVSH